jgi:hypothetical protein
VGGMVAGADRLPPGSGRMDDGTNMHRVWRWDRLAGVQHEGQKPPDFYRRCSFGLDQNPESF